MAEWPKATVLKTVRGNPRGFESYFLRMTEKSMPESVRCLIGEVLKAEASWIELVEDLRQLVDEGRKGDFANKSMDFGRGVSFMLDRVEEVLNRNGVNDGTNRGAAAGSRDPS